MILTIINTNDILYGHTCPCADHIIGSFLSSTGKVYHAAIALFPSWIFKYELEGLASIYKLQSEPNLTEEVCTSSSFTENNIRLFSLKARNCGIELPLMYFEVKF